MRVFTVDGKNYKLPNSLNSFQQEMYIHLIDWKWRYITAAPGLDDGLEYDAILPASDVQTYPMLYPDIAIALQKHLQKYPFRIHKYFNHMASCQYQFVFADIVSSRS